MGAGILCPPAMHGRTKPPHAQAYRGAGAYRRVKLAIVSVSSAARSFLSSNILPHAPGRFNVIKCKIPPFLAAPHTKSALAGRQGAFDSQCLAGVPPCTAARTSKKAPFARSVWNFDATRQNYARSRVQFLSNANPAKRFAFDAF